jgi:RNA polymerase sigma-70 factor, ECF subfamily
MSEREVGRFEQVVLPHLDAAYTLARYLLRDEHDAQDVVQESVLRALRYFRTYRDGDARAWLLAIVRNNCHSWRAGRGVDRLSVPLADASETAADPRRADELAIRSSERARIEGALATLPEALREVIVLREVNDLSYQEISDVAGIPLGTVMSRLSRARQRLIRALGPDEREAC